MREMLFHGKSKDDGEWIEGSLIISDEQYFIVPVFGVKSIDNLQRSSESEKQIMLFAIEVIPETVGQYIGMVDKNGKKIFEGNIICAHTSIVAAVKYNEYRAAFIRESLLFISNFLHIDSNDMEIIGNIHDNPDLLGGGDNGEKV